MRLYIGRNHQHDDRPVESVFRLAGNDEDALTYALGFLLARDREFCRKVLRRCGVRPSRSLLESYTVRLQEVTDVRFGRRDVVVEGAGSRVVLEAKVGRSEPSVFQLLKYAEEERVWADFQRRAIIALTQVELLPATRSEMQLRLSRQRIAFHAVQWHQILELALQHRPQDCSLVARFLHDEFIRYATKDYDMGYYDAEVLIQDVNPLNAEIFRDCWMYVTSLKDKRAPLYFAPYCTQQGSRSGISQVGKVVATKVVRLIDEPEPLEVGAAEQLKRWRKGLARLRKRAICEGFAESEVRLFFLDEPLPLANGPLSKKAFNSTGPVKQIPRQIPKGFSLDFDELIRGVRLASAE